MEKPALPSTLLGYVKFKGEAQYPAVRDELNSQIADVEGQIADERNDASLGIDGANERAEELSLKLNELVKVRDTLQRHIDELHVWALKRSTIMEKPALPSTLLGYVKFKGEAQYPAVRDELNSQIADVEGQIADERNDASLGIDGANERAEELSLKLNELVRVRDTLKRHIDELERFRSLKKIEDDMKNTRDRPRELAKLAKFHVETAREAEHLATKLGEKLRLLEATGVRLAHLSDNSEAKRLFGLGPLTLRICRAFSKKFDSIKNEFTSPGQPPHRFIAFELPFRGEAYYQHTLDQLEQQALDGVPIDVFLTREEAIASRDRRDPSGRTMHVVPDGELWRVVQGEIKGAAKKLHG